jgi:hypothetical protein
MKQPKVPPSKEDVMNLVNIIHDPDISSEARTMAIGMLEKMVGREIKNKRDVFAIQQEYDKAKAI